ncbi:eukaryotic aspartyl protease [Phlyctema vagabunda]|uniref:Eukaryotic aspartyl protease n=1 Tax=Phlyctema vagabunda TaxID=108571 RepID=A0ABR4PFH2_9HELO
MADLLHHNGCSPASCIINGGVCNLDLLEQTIESQIKPRLEGMWMTGFYDPSTASTPPMRPVDEFVNTSIVTNSTHYTNAGFQPTNDQDFQSLDKLGWNNDGNVVDSNANGEQTITASVSESCSVTFQQMESVEEHQLVEYTENDSVQGLMHDSVQTTDQALKQGVPIADSAHTKSAGAVSFEDAVELRLISEVWNGNNPANYRVQLNLGQDPDDSFWLEVDSGSPILWVHAQCSDADTPPLSKRVFDVSKTAEYMGVQPYSCKYADHTEVEVEWYKDDFNLGSLVASSQVFGAAPYGSLSQRVKESQSQGLIGLANWTPRISAPKHDNLVVNLARQGRIKFASFALVGPRNNPVQAQADTNKTTRPRGRLIIGAVSRKWYSGEIAWCPWLKEEYHQWVVELDEVWINDYKIAEKQLAFIDSGTSYIMTSPQNALAVRSVLHGTVCGKEEAAFEYAPGALSTVTFVLGGRLFTLNPDDLSLGRNASGNDISSILTLGKGVKWPFAQRMWVLGGILLDNIVTVFDYTDHRIGFATLGDEGLRDDVAD